MMTTKKKMKKMKMNATALSAKRLYKSKPVPQQNGI
jgi:hypothetical protein